MDIPRAAAKIRKDCSKALPVIPGGCTEERSTRDWVVSLTNMTLNEVVIPAGECADQDTRGQPMPAQRWPTEFYYGDGGLEQAEAKDFVCVNRVIADPWRQCFTGTPVDVRKAEDFLSDEELDLAQGYMDSPFHDWVSQGEGKGQGKAWWTVGVPRVPDVLVRHKLTGSSDTATIAVSEVVFTGHVAGNRQRKPIPGKVAMIEHWEEPKTVSELRAYLGFCDYSSGYIKMYDEYAAPTTAMLRSNRAETKQGSKKALVWNDESDGAFDGMKQALLSAVGLHLVVPKRGFILRKDASNYAGGAVLEQVSEDWSHVCEAFSSRVLVERQRGTWTPREKEVYAILMALRKWAGYIALHLVTVCTEHQSLQSWHKEHMNTALGSACRRCRCRETWARFAFTVVYVPGKDNTVAACLSRWPYPASKGMTDLSAHGDVAETAEAKKIIDMERMMEEDGVKCFVVMAADAPLGRRVSRAVCVLPPEGGESHKRLLQELCLQDNWTNDYAK